ncbi:MAG: hypothetical protein K2W94_08045 [Alphaproteobacteria bacterium]|nr:hypothetical protein [Alphaproteobacteria bacterium]
MTAGFFVGRKEEIQKLDFLLAKKKASLVVIRGRRRIGKSRLVEEFSKKKTVSSVFRDPPNRSHYRSDAAGDIC